MSYFLMVFDRQEGRVLRQREYSGRAEALRARFRAERQHPDRENVEIVVLTADSEADLRHTHARYFESVDQIAATGLRRLDAVMSA